MWNEALHMITPDMWKNSIQHTEREIFKWYERERIFDRPEISPIVINFNSEESDTDVESDEENEQEFESA